jgi:hypothetical protein
MLNGLPHPSGVYGLAHLREAKEEPESRQTWLAATASLPAVALQPDDEILSR